MPISPHLRRKFYSGINVYPMHPLVGFDISCATVNGFRIMIHWQVSIWVLSFIARMLPHQIAMCLPSSARLVFVSKLALILLLPNQAANTPTILSSRMNYMATRRKSTKVVIPNVEIASWWINTSPLWKDVYPTLLERNVMCTLMVLCSWIMPVRKFSISVNCLTMLPRPSKASLVLKP